VDLCERVLDCVSVPVELADKTLRGTPGYLLRVRGLAINVLVVQVQLIAATRRASRAICATDWVMYTYS
jgi:hypothetical protein